MNIMMEKKIYVQPSIEAYVVSSSSIICGSGGQTGSLPSGSGGEEPTPSGGGITCEAKSAFGFDFSEEE